MLYGALPRIMQYVFSSILLYLLYKRFSRFFNGFYIAIQNEKQTQNINHTKTNVNDLNSILERLTEREKDVFELLVQGYTNAQIANQLYLSNGTVKNYVSIIYDKIGMKDRTALILQYSPFYRDHD
ncbi:response regulator transcription factor [Lachnospiraceae bacterium MD1]|uniref:Response regulator transcription factor n=2 Tax=Variimorphobacter saccharofermentans TaxID=2755051 RepID=A0A839JWZ7_9FIRM|nr:response regulator transcription factor [Variimorphobacter saccharofermentans]